MSPCTQLLALAVAVSTAAGITPTAARAETTQVDAQQIKAQQRQRNEALRAARQWVQRNPERAARLGFTRLKPDTDTARASPIEVRLRNGETYVTLADPMLYGLLSIGYAELKAQDRSNLTRLYTQLHAMLPLPMRTGLPDPTLLPRMPMPDLTRAVQAIGRQVVLNLDAIRILISRTSLSPGLTSNPIGPCAAEIGYEVAGSDSEVSARCGVLDYSVLGLMRNFDFVLKDDLTCVKDQGARGTCVAHAVAANVESMVMVQGGAPQNLSEQDLYLWAKVNTDMDNHYNDGLDPDEVYDALMARHFRLQYESMWNYNRSLDRKPVLNASNEFPGSCDSVNYSGEMCTNYAFQGEETSIGFGYFVYGSPPRSPLGWEVLNWTSIPDLASVGLPEFQIDTAIIALESEYPLHITMVVPRAFRNPDAFGYVLHDPTDPVPPGSHSVLAVGFVANSALPPGAPQDPDGRGFFILKNSWGTDYADCGFVYVSTEFLRNWATAYRYLDKTVTYR